MKRILILIVMMSFVLFLVGCREKVNVDFKIDGTSHVVRMSKGSVITDNIVPLNNNVKNFKLYYDESYLIEYKQEKIENNLTIYVKVDNSLTLEQEKFMEINFKIGYQNMNMSIGYFGEKFEIVLIHSVNELSNLSNQKIDLLSKYDSDFFEKNSLIIYNKQMNTMGNEITITNVLKDNDRIYIKLNLKYGYMDALSNGIIIIEILKNDCENIKSVEIIEG